MGKCFICCRIQFKFCFEVCLKPSNGRGEFELDRARCYKNIAEIIFALGHETDSNFNSVQDGFILQT